MGLSAIGSLADSIEATRDFLFSPLEPRRWLALALVVFFAGGVGGFNPMGLGNLDQQTTQQPGSAPTEGDVQTEIQELQTFVTDNLGTILAVLATVLAIWLLFRLLSAIFQFVFVESLRRESVDVLGYAGQNLRKGAGLFGFRLGVDVLSAVPVVLLGYVLWDPIVGSLLDSGTVDGAAIPWDTVLPLVAVGVAVGVLAAIVHGLTTSFVVPTMLVEDAGVLAGWRRFLPVFVGSIVEYVVYAILAFVLRLALGSVAGVLTGIASLLVLFPLGLLGILTHAGLGTGTGAVIVFAFLFVVAFLLTILVATLVQVPFASYLRYYALFLLGDTEPEIDPVPETRARVREDPMPGSEEPA